MILFWILETTGVQFKGTRLAETNAMLNIILDSAIKGILLKLAPLEDTVSHLLGLRISADFWLEHSLQGGTGSAQPQLLGK